VSFEFVGGLRVDVVLEAFFYVSVHVSLI
jgi:hypothetical protein